MSTVLALSGGVGGAKLVHGLAQVLPAEQLVVCCNTGDDFTHVGQHVCPDIDTVLYTLSGLANPELGWGRADETWHFMDTMAVLGGETWFRLGDADLAMHVVRSQALAAGQSISAITADLARRLGVAPTIAPMSDQPVSTIVLTPDGELAFQHYFVRERCAPVVTGFRFEGAAAAKPAPAVAATLGDPKLRAILFCPSNPYVSLGPILAVKDIAAALARRRAPAIAVSPIVGGVAIKGPAAKMMAELGQEVSATAVARLLRPYIDGFVIDDTDADQADGIRSMGLKVEVAPTVMRNTADKRALAEAMLAFADRMRTA